MEFFLSLIKVGIITSKLLHVEVLIDFQSVFRFTIYNLSRKYFVNIDLYTDWQR